MERREHVKHLLNDIEIRALSSTSTLIKKKFQLANISPKKKKVQLALFLFFLIINFDDWDSH